ncbi:efflux RND transporter permease subunit [Nitratifractor sp.]
MFERILRFSIERYRVNYALFFLIVALGIYSYWQLPKEVSPAIEPDSITVRGHYAGASIDTLNAMAVGELEAEIRNIDGIRTITSVVSPGRFSIVAELEKGVDKARVSKEIEDAITAARSNLPSDMDEPTVRSVAHSRSLMHIAVLSETLPRNELIRIARELRKKILAIPDVSDVTIFGDSEEYYSIELDEKRLEAFGLDIAEVARALSELSYIYPIGQIEGKRRQFFLSTQNRERSPAEIGETILDLGDQRIRLGEIARIEKRLDNFRTLASMNGKDAMTLAVSQNPKGDALRLASQVRSVLEAQKVPGVEFEVRRDQSRVIRDRLNVVISNILFAIVLIVGLMSLLINARLAFVIALGIPTSFIIGAIYFHLAGYSINVNSLVGVLIAIGIIVDDAIVVSENIQQYIQRGYPPKEAAIRGTMEMAKPVTIASLTTLFSFIPLLMISGRLGEIIQLIPIALSVLVLASLLESFFFLPVHASHLLRPGARTLSWEGANRLYRSWLEKIARHRRVFLPLFVLVTLGILWMQISSARFQIFQRFDSETVDITFKAKSDTTLEESLAIVQRIERDLLAQRKRFAIRQISSTAGYRRSATGTPEMYPYVGYLSIELYPRKPQNFVERYITPMLSFYRSSPVPKIRERSSREISRDLRRWLKERNYRRRFGLRSISVLERRMGHSKADIRIGVISDDYQQAISAVRQIEGALAKEKGVKFFGDNIKFGIEEIKIGINAYGKRLGVTRRYLGEYLSRLYLPGKVGVVYNGKELLDIKLRSINKDDYEAFKNLRIRLRDGTVVSLGEIATLKKVPSLERLVKDDGATTFYLFANVDPAVATDGEILERLRPLLSRLEKEGLRFRFRGEAEQKRHLRTDLLLASALAVVLIFISLLYLFDSVRDTLIVMSVIPLSFLGVFAGHTIMGLNISLPSLIGALGLAGVIVNDGIIMMSTIKAARSVEEFYTLASRRLRPIVLTTITTLAGLSSLIFFASGEALTFQPIAVSLGFGLLWGTILNLFYLPVFYLWLAGGRLRGVGGEAV